MNDKDKKPGPLWYVGYVALIIALVTTFTYIIINHPAH